MQITIVDVREGVLFGSTLKEGCSMDKVEVGFEQIVYADVTSILPLYRWLCVSRTRLGKQIQERMEQYF